MTASREQVEETIIAAWNHATWQANGCYPMESDDIGDLLFIRGFALGHLGCDGYDRVRSRLTRWPRIDQPAVPEPPRVTRFDLEKLVRS